MRRESGYSGGNSGHFRLKCLARSGCLERGRLFGVRFPALRIKRSGGYRGNGAPFRALRGIPGLRLLTPLDGLDGCAEDGVGIFKTDAIEYEADRADVEPLQDGGGFTELGASGCAGLDDDDGAVDKTGEILGFCRLGKGRRIGEDQALLLGLGIAGNLLKESGGTTQTLDGNQAFGGFRRIRS